MNWTRQPPTFTGFNPRYPKPGFCFLPSAHQRADLVRGYVGTAGTSEAVRATAQGMAYNSIDQTSGGLNFGNILAINSEAWTILVVANPASASQRYKGFSQRSAGANTPAINLVWNSTRTDGLSAGKFTAYGNFAATKPGADTDGTPVDGRWHVWGATRTGTTVGTTLWIDGAMPAQTATTGSVSLLAAAAETKIGGSGAETSNVYTYGGNTALCLTWDSVLPGAVMVELGRNPWQLFAPLPARVYSFPTFNVVPPAFRHYQNMRAA